MKKKQEEFVTIQETWIGNGCEEVQMFNQEGDNISKKIPVAKFITEYKERLNKAGKYFAKWPKLNH